MTTSVGNNSVFKSFFEKQKLTGPNFIDWYRQLRLVLSTEDKEKNLEQPIPTTVKDFHTCKQEEGQSVSSYVLKMKSYIDQLERLGHPVTLNLGVSLILVGLFKEYDSFVQNYNMHNMGKTVHELHAMLKLHEETLPKKVTAPALHAIRAGKVQKNKNKKPSKAAKGVQGKGKGKKAYANAEPSYAPKPKNPPPPKKDNPAKDAICHHCGEVGHWRINCPIYLTELLKKKQLSLGASTSGIFTIELYSFPSTSWVYDTGCGTHICNITQGLRGSKKLNLEALSLYMGNGQRAAVEAIGNCHLCLPSGLVIVLKNCHYAPSITREIISVSRLYEDGFINRFELNNAISVSKNNVVYFTAIPRDGLYEIEMSYSNTNDSSMYAISNKRAKLDLDSSFLWHCRLRHISKKHIEKLQHDGLLNSSDIESLGKCVSCMSGKMARKPYSHQMERAKDILGLIHTDLCGPFRIVSRQGANYFVTFTADFSRHGYVYLLKHKHEVFETFKVFQKEVENQLGKTIKSLRSDRGGEYMSQEFLDHLKEHGIIAHHTPPYMPQHNGVSERRNRTLLDMVRSMMSHTTLPKSFGIIPLRYPKETIGYSFYNSSENKVFVAQNAEFFESNLIDQEDDQEINEPQSDINPIRRSTRTRRPTYLLCLYIDAEEHKLGDLGEPANYKAALKDPESKKWLAAMNVDMQSMKDNYVWELVEFPPNAKTVGHKWLFKKKTDMDGAIHTFKSCLIAKGFTQTYGTFSPVADIRAIRILIAISAFYDYEI
ncbi:retrotransposon protein, putative, ty1-copia subclass, partial [Tanacetum coccineum]